MSIFARLTHTTKTKILLSCGAVGAPLFILVFLLEGITRRDYNPFRHPVSALSIGADGWMQAGNFLLTGSLFLAFAFGLKRALVTGRGSRWGPRLLTLIALGLIGAGCFACDPMNGYPPGTALVPIVRSLHGRLHDLFSAPVFLCLPAACFVLSRRFAGLGKTAWSAYSLLSGVLMLTAFVLAAMGFRQVAGFADFAGLFQRLSIGIGWLWIAMLSLYLRSEAESV